MAITGIKHPVFAPITGRPAGAKPTYGTGILVAKATKVDITINTAEGKLYADDSLAEYDSKFQSATIAAGVDDLTLNKQAVSLIVHVRLGSPVAFRLLSVTKLMRSPIDETVLPPFFPRTFARSLRTTALQRLAIRTHPVVHLHLAQDARHVQHYQLVLGLAGLHCREAGTDRHVDERRQIQHTPMTELRHHLLSNVLLLVFRERHLAMI